jgi:dTDP-4-amino-4,6-dideoxy-D-galactose acyltransferase
MIECEEYISRASEIDTYFFGIPTAIVVLKKSCSSIQSQDDLIRFMNGFSLSMITNKSNDPVNNLWLGKRTNAFLTDINVQFRKKVCHPGDVRHQAAICDQFPENQSVIHLAETSFKYSRFINDPYIQPEKAKFIYADIVRNAFGKPGRFFATVESQDAITGFLLFSMYPQTSSATVELIAIDENSTGRGIGPSLIRSVEAFLCEHGIETMGVGTQLQNINALKFYSNMGFKIVECNSIYHCWPGK